MDQRHKRKSKTIELLEENIGKSFMTLDLAMISWMLHKKYRQRGLPWWRSG